jgi:hypothetical protein
MGSLTFVIEHMRKVLLDAQFSGLRQWRTRAIQRAPKSTLNCYNLLTVYPTKGKA